MVMNICKGALVNRKEASYYPLIIWGHRNIIAIINSVNFCARIQPGENERSNPFVGAEFNHPFRLTPGRKPGQFPRVESVIPIRLIAGGLSVPGDKRLFRAHGEKVL